MRKRRRLSEESKQSVSWKSSLGKGGEKSFVTNDECGMVWLEISQIQAFARRGIFGRPGIDVACSLGDSVMPEMEETGIGVVEVWPEEEGEANDGGPGVV